MDSAGAWFIVGAMILAIVLVWAEHERKK